MPLNKAAAGPKMNGYHGQGAPGVEGPMGRNDGVLYGRMPGGENAAASMWSAQDHMGMRHPGLGNGRMQGMPGLRPSGENAVIHGMDALQISEGQGPPARTQRQKMGEGERQEETDDDMFAMFRFKVHAPYLQQHKPFQTYYRRKIRRKIPSYSICMIVVYLFVCFELSITSDVRPDSRCGVQVVPCSKQFVHDWKECSFAHEGETARRRHP